MWHAGDCTRDYLGEPRKSGSKEIEMIGVYRIITEVIGNLVVLGVLIVAALALNDLRLRRKAARKARKEARG